jgi:hypothetical protein
MQSHQDLRFARVAPCPGVARAGVPHAVGVPRNVRQCEIGEVLRLRFGHGLAYADRAKAAGLWWPPCGALSASTAIF